VDDQHAITCLSDIEKIEALPFEQRGLPQNTYAAINEVAQRHPEAIALRYIENVERWVDADDSEKHSLVSEIDYATFIGNIHRTANAFRSLGIGDNDIVSMILPNVPEAHFTLWAAEAAGIVNPINFLLEEKEIGEIIQSAGSKVLVAHGNHPELDIAEKLPQILATASCLEHVLIVGDMPKNIEKAWSFSDLVNKQNGELDFKRNIQANDVASLFHTGGTTGLPKLARHTHINEVYTAWATNRVLQNTHGDCALTGLPLFHCNAAIATGLLTFMSGGTVFLAGINGFRSPGVVKNLFQLIDYFKVTSFSAVPTVYAALAQIPSVNYNLSTIKSAGCGAAPMPIEQFKKFKNKTGIRICEGYGLTEATVTSTVSPPAAEARIGSIGLRLPYTQIRIAVIDADGNFVRECAQDEVGTILIRGPSVSPGYTDESKNKSLFVIDPQGSSWLNTGDLARQDKDGYYWLVGRSKELIIRGGHNIDPKMIEEVLAQHEAVNLAAAIGRPDSYAGEVPVAYVDTVADKAGSVTSEELLEFCKANIGERAAVPKDISIMEKLPVTGVGKIHKPTLHLIELKKVVEKELDHFAEKISELEVKTQSTSKNGNTAQIRITANPDATAAELEQEIKQALGMYSFTFTVEVNG
jgi:fatty-acyl-CoA synthase